MPTLDQLKEFLISMGVPLPPDFVLQALLDAIAPIQACLIGAGHSASNILLINLYLLSLMVLSTADRYISSQTAPSGASQSYKYQDLINRYRSLKAMLDLLDTSGCTDDLVPAEPGPSAGLWVSKGGCC